MIFEVPGKPQGKQRARVCVQRGYARAYTPDETVSYESLIKLCYREASGGNAFGTKSVQMEIVAYYPIPKSFSKKRTAEALQWLVLPLVKPDIDNVIKIVCDALNGIAYRDDTQIVKISAEKRYSEAPRLLIKILEN